MNFKSAMKLLCEGWKVKRKKWQGQEYLQVRTAVHQLSDHDMSSTDWEVK
jgi:hypothetical protein